MKKALLLALIILAIIVALFASGVWSNNSSDLDSPAGNFPSSLIRSLDLDLSPQIEPTLVFPVDEYVERRTYKGFGEYFSDRFVGYHAGEDAEYVDDASDVPVYAISEGVIRQQRSVSGYGGLIVVEHAIDGKQITALYGHIDLNSTRFSVGDDVEMGNVLGYLGDHESTETDGERKHLHFGLYEGYDGRINGYESNEVSVLNWLNPSDVFAAGGLDVTMARQFDPEIDLGGDIFNISFLVPDGYEVEYIPQIESLNIYKVEGEGLARSRSDIFIRYFDASDFLTLSTVTIFNEQDLTIGSQNYIARQYDIEKNAGITDFPHQPDWRNERHVVMDVRGENGFTRYFVIAKNPDLDQGVYDAFLSNLVIE